MQKIPVRHINTTQKEPDFSGSFSIRDINALLGGEDMVQELHRHDFYYILALKKGAGNHEIDFTPYKIGDYSIFYMRPGQVHKLLLKAGGTGYLMQFSDAFYAPHDAAARLLRNAGNISHYQLTEGRCKKLFAVLTYIFNEYMAKEDSYQQVIKANMGIFFIELMREYNRTPAPNANPYMQQRLDEFLQLLPVNIVHQKQVAEYAAMLSLSAYQLNAVTKTMLGKTPSQLINDYIILEAKRYLLATPNQVNQIADHLGYEDPSYFIRFFKKHTGYSPEAFRHNFS